MPTSSLFLSRVRGALPRFSFTNARSSSPVKSVGLLIAVGAFLPADASALDTTTRLVSPVQSWTEESLATYADHWIHVKFVEGSDVELVLPGSGAPLTEARFVDPGSRDLSQLNAALAAADLRSLRPTFDKDRATLRSWKSRGEAATGTVGPDLSLWFDVEVATSKSGLADLLNKLNADPNVEIAHPAPVVTTAALQFDDAPRNVAGSASANRGGTPDFTAQQAYLYDTPTGLDAPSAWAIPGGTGTDVKFVDVELGWAHDHEDFNFDNFFFEGGVPQGTDNHGTAVMGEVVGQHNDFGISGFAPDVAYGTVAILVSEWPNVAHRFQEAVDALDPGDVWLIELQMFPSGRDATPMEYLQVNYDVIWTSSWALDIVCIEAGANGSQDLDDPSWGGIFDRNQRDSGAILVGAGTPFGRVAESFTNYGSRCDASAWGSQIVTTGYGNLYNGGSAQTQYTSSFGGTSGASPMVTGSALALQGIHKEAKNSYLPPVTIRQILTDTGVPNLGSRYIGPRPDLAAAANAVLTAANVELGDFRLVLDMSVSPNPVRGDANIRFRLDEDGPVRVDVVDVRGRILTRLTDGVRQAGDHEVQWNGEGPKGPLPSGVYFIRVEGEEAETARRVSVLR